MSLTGAAEHNMQTPAAAKGKSGKRKSLGGKANSKEMIVKLLTKMTNKQGEKRSDLEWQSSQRQQR